MTASRRRPVPRNDVWPLVLWLLGIAGVICLVLAAIEVPKLWWPTVTATARDCGSVEQVGARGRVQVRYHCDLVWRYDDGTHHRRFTEPPGTVHDGDHVPLRVHGDTAADPDSVWTSLPGLAVLGTGLLFFPLRALRRRFAR